MKTTDEKSSVGTAHMPGMNGIEVLRKLPARPSKSDVLVLSSSQDDKLLQDALARAKGAASPLRLSQFGTSLLC